MAEKKAFNFYRSYHDVLKCLDDSMYVKLSRAINSVMFFEVHIDSIDFSEPMLQLSWAAIKHSLKQSIDGYLSRNKLQYNQALSTPPQGACQGGSKGAAQQGEEEVKEKEKETRERERERARGRGRGTYPAQARNVRHSAA